MEIKRYELDWAGRKLVIEFGRYAHQANATCTVQYGDTLIMANALMSDESRDIPWFPLMVEYQEKMYAAGKIKGSRFIKRETRPSDMAVLTARLVDRAIRPLFDETMRNEMQVVVTALSFDGENDPDVPCIIGAAAALLISDIPWDGPIAGARVSSINGKFVLNPTIEQEEESTLNLFVAGDGTNTIMLEANGVEAPDEDAIKAIEFAQEHIKPVIKLMEKIRKEIGIEKIPSGEAAIKLLSDEEQAKHKEIQRVNEIARNKTFELTDAYLVQKDAATKGLRKASIKGIKADLKEFLASQDIEDEIISKVAGNVKEFIEEKITDFILSTKKRIDGRGLEDIRPLNIDVSLLPRPHGTGMFMRGETQVLSVLTLGSPGDEQILDEMGFDGKKRYMHHYNFPGYSVGEVKPFRGASRRDIGHGALAEKALLPVVPPKEEFPYTIRVVSEVLGSNGSSSMASICGSTLALMDGGVPIKEPVAGIAMGLVSNSKGDFEVLTDLQDLEDAKGGMDFKVAGTRNGLTAIQMDTKTKGITPNMISMTVEQAKRARLRLLDEMAKIIAEPREELSAYAPRIETVQIDPEKIGLVIGPGGAQIKEIVEETDADINIEDDGQVFITTADAAMMKKAKEWIENITKEAVIGETYEGTVTRILDFGAVVEILPKQDGLVHISEMSYERVDKVTDVVKLGDKVKVKLLDIEPSGKKSLSIKALMPKPEGYVERQPSRSPRGGGRGGDRDRGGRNPRFKRDR